MILDINKTDIETCNAAKVFFNGIEQVGVVLRCNDETGEAEVYVHTITGRLASTGFGSSRRLLTRRVKTNVTIEIPAGVSGGPYQTPQKD